MHQYLFISYELGLIARSAGSVAAVLAGVFIDGVLHRESSNWNHKLNDITFLDSMEDNRYEWRKQNGPDFVAAASSGGSASNPPEFEGGVDQEAADDEFDAALEKRRKHCRGMKANTHNKLNRLVDVAACPSRMCGGGDRQGG